MNNQKKTLAPNQRWSNLHGSPDAKVTTILKDFKNKSHRIWQPVLEEVSR